MLHWTISEETEGFWLWLDDSVVRYIGILPERLAKMAREYYYIYIYVYSAINFSKKIFISFSSAFHGLVSSLFWLHIFRVVSLFPCVFNEVEVCYCPFCPCGLIIFLCNHLFFVLLNKYLILSTYIYIYIHFKVCLIWYIPCNILKLLLFCCFRPQVSFPENFGNCLLPLKFHFQKTLGTAIIS
jgi:hypothetical protein